MTDELTILACSQIPICNQRLDKYVVGYYTMQFMERGSVDLAYDDRWTRMEGPYFWPAFPGPRLRFHAAPGCPHWFHRHIGFRGPRVQKWIASGLWPTEAQPAPLGEDWPMRFDTMIEAARAYDHWSQLRALNLLEGILIDLAAARVPTVAEPAWLTPVLEYLSAEGTFAPDYSSLATSVGMGESTLRRRFKETTGLSLHTYVLQTRTTRARTLLTETDLPIKAVAERLGYESVYFFARQFRQQVGLPPGHFRKSRQL